MGTEFRKKKVTHIFQKFFDKDNSKFIEKKDFDLSVEYIGKQRGWQPGDAQYKALADSMNKVWDSLQKHADKDNDGQVSLEEWVAMCDDFAKNPSSPLEWQSLYCKVIFGIQDASGDGVIDVDEFTAVLESFKRDKQNAITAFEKMTQGKSTISWEEFQELWRQFFTSEDLDAPGNYIFGVVDYTSCHCK